MKIVRSLFICFLQLCTLSMCTQVLHTRTVTLSEQRDLNISLQPPTVLLINEYLTDVTGFVWGLTLWSFPDKII